MDDKLTMIIYGLLGDVMDILLYCKEMVRYNQQLNDDEITELQKQIDKLGSSRPLEDLLLKKWTTKE